MVRRGVLTEECAEEMRRYTAGELDPELRKNDVYTENFPEEIVMKNERFGPWPDPEKVTRIRP